MSGLWMPAAAKMSTISVETTARLTICWMARSRLRARASAIGSCCGTCAPMAMLMPSSIPRPALALVPQRGYPQAPSSQESPPSTGSVGMVGVGAASATTVGV